MLILKIHNIVSLPPINHNCYLVFFFF